MEISDEARRDVANIMELTRQEEARQAVARHKSKAEHLGWVLVLLLAVSAFVVFWLIKSRKGTENRPYPIPTTPGAVISTDIRLYTFRQAGIGTFLCGPLAGVYMLHRNFVVMNKPVLANSTLVYGLGYCLLLVGILPFLPDEFTKPGFSVAHAVCIVIVMKDYHFDRKMIEKSPEYACQSGWSAALVSLVGFVVLIVVAMAWMLAVS